MFENIKNLVSKIADEKVKNSLLDEIKKAEENSVDVNSIKIDDLLKDDKFAGLAQNIVSYKDSEVGRNRTKWELEKTQKNTDTPKKEDDTPDLSKQLQELISPLVEKINKLEGNSNVNSMKSYADTKIKENSIPKQFSSLIRVTEKTTQEEIDSQINDIKSSIQSYSKDTFQTDPFKSKTKDDNIEDRNAVDDYIDNLINDKK